MGGVSDQPLADVVPTDDLWRNRTFVANVIALAISVTGDGFHSVALSIWVLQTTRSATAMALIMAAQVVVGILLGAVAGAVCDRVDRRWLMVVADVMRAGLVFGLAVVIGGNDHALVGLIVLKACIAVGTIVHTTAFHAALVTIVGRQAVTRAGSIVQLTRTVALIVGPVVGGAVMGFTGAAMAMNVDAISYGVSAVVIVLGGYFPSVVGGEGTSVSFWNALSDGFAYMKQQPFILSLAILLPLFNLFANSAILLVPVIAVTIWNTSQVAFGLLQGLMTLGFASGAVFLMVYGERVRRRGYWMLGSWVTMGAMGTAIMVMPRLLPATPFVFVAGITISFVNIFLTSALQREVVPEMQGRVMGILNSLNDVATPVAILVSGVLADVLGPVVVGVVLCLMCTILAAVSVVVFPAIRRYQ